MKRRGVPLFCAASMALQSLRGRVEWRRRESFSIKALKTKNFG